MYKEKKWRKDTKAAVQKTPSAAAHPNFSPREPRTPKKIPASDSLFPSLHFSSWMVWSGEHYMPPARQPMMARKR
jgi:hypothetical protein